MSLRCSIGYLCLDDKNGVSIHIWREAGSEDYWLDIEKDCIRIPRKLAVALSRVLDKNKGFEDCYHGLMRTEDFKPYYQQRGYKKMMKEFFKEAKK